ncbi:hypothetical protein [Wolbachia endosymbiont of Oedothorax gibbosus]|uniref:hypothetical protein n=1 Tax=Wolbachia endosymbiont of Oedothorax gibbosus TaxID=931100 RepID=UPI002024DD1F|nr:hypothetical protein [Wolbachia endosymbiont of Oedothorax gibbosus]
MSGTIEGSQNKPEGLGRLSEEQWDKFVKDSLNEEKEELKAAEEKSKTNKEKSIEILEKHFHDRTLQPLSEFNKTGEKETGFSSGFQAEHQYKDDKATFMIKSILNHTLTEKEKQSKLEQFKESFYKGSRKATKLQNPNLTDSQIDDLIDPLWQQVESNICYDDLNIADFVREYVAGDLYKLLLHDRAPIVELVTNNDLPEKRFKRDEMHKDQFKEHIEQEKKQDKLYLRSKFLDKFTTLMDLKEKGENYQGASGFEKILAAQMLLGEADIIQPENFGVIEKECENAKGEKVKEKLWAKINHGRSLYFCVNHWSQILLWDLKTLCGIEVEYKKLAFELSTHAKTISENEKLIDRLIDKKASNLNQLLNPEMKFTLRYISSNLPLVLCEEVFNYSAESKGFVSDKGNSLGGYFKQRLQNQIQIIREYSEVLHVVTAIENDLQSLAVNLPAFFNSQFKDPLIWAIESGKKLDGKDPIVWAVDNDKNIDGKNPIIWAIGNDKEIEGKKPGKWSAEHDLLINGKSPEAFASKVRLAQFVNKASLPIAGLAAVACIGFVIANLSIALIISAAAVALIAALVAKPIALYVQKNLLRVRSAERQNKVDKAR